MSGPRAWTAPGSAIPSGQPSQWSGVGSPDQGPPPVGSGEDAPAEGEIGGVASSAADGTPGTVPGTGTAADQADLLGGEIPFRPLGIAEILDGSIACIRHHPRVVLGLSLLFTVVVQVVNSVGGYLLLDDQGSENLTAGPLMRLLGTQLTLSLLSLLMSAYGTLLLAGLLSPVVSRTLFGQPVSLRLAWQDVRPVTVRLVVTAAVVLTVSVLVAVLPLLLLLALLAAAEPSLAWVAVTLLCLPVALALMVWLYVLLVPALPAVVLERQTVPAALRRARQLSRKRWWHTCSTLLLTLVITIFMGFLALRLPFLFAQLVLFGDGSGDGALLGSLTIDTLGRIVSWSLVTPFDAGVIALLYVDRRMRREGFDLDVRTRRFDNAGHPLDIWRPVSFSPAGPPPGFGPYPPFPPPAPPAPPGWPHADRIGGPHGR